MSLGLWKINDALVEQLRDHVTAVTVCDGDPAGARSPTAAVWVHKTTDEIDWRGLGAAAWNREEQLSIELRAYAYRESVSHQQDARRAAEQVVRALVEQVEHAISLDQSLGQACTDTRLARVTAKAVPVKSGWEAQADLVVTCRYIPTPGATP